MAAMPNPRASSSRIAPRSANTTVSTNCRTWRLRLIPTRLSTVPSILPASTHEPDDQPDAESPGDDGKRVATRHPLEFGHHGARLVLRRGGDFRSQIRRRLADLRADQFGHVGDRILELGYVIAQRA